MKKLYAFYLSRRKHFNIGLAMHLFGGLIIAILRSSILPIALMFLAFMSWFMYDYYNYKGNHYD